MKTVLAITHPYERRIVLGLTALFFILLIAYTYFISATVFHVTARKSVEYQNQIVAARVADLEATFLVKSDAITADAVEAFALQPVQEKRFVRIAPDRTLTLYDES